MGSGATLPAVPTLRRWGFSPTADLMYRTLVLFGERQPRAAATELGIQIADVLSACAELEVAGLGRRRPDGSWVAVPWTRAATPGVRARRSPFPLRDLLPSAVERGAAVRLLPNAVAVRDRLGELAAGERHEHLAMNNEPAFSADVRAAASPRDLALLERGVAMRSVGLAASTDDDLAGDDELIRCGAQLRVAPNVPTKLMVFDRTRALVAVDPDDLSRGAFEIAEPSLVAALVALFEQTWELAKEPTMQTTLQLSEREDALLALLAAGHTDESAAVRLGVSVRTVAYTVRSLMDRLGVDNRFQLGLAVGAFRTTDGPR